MKPIHESTKHDLLSSHATNEYNDDGALREISYGPQLYVEYEYDNCGNKTKIVQYEDGIMSTKEWLYDERNMVIEVKQDGTVIIRYEYTQHGNVSRMTYPRTDGQDRVIRYRYDNDHIGRVAEIVDETDDKKPRLIRKYEYNEDGVISHLLDYRCIDLDNNYSNFTVPTFSFDTEGRLLRFAYTDMAPDSCSILRESYELKYDHAGNIIMDTSYTNYVTPTTVAREYEYDSSNRLVREMVNGETIAEYSFDSNGNRKTLTTNTSTLYYDYNELNELARIAGDPNFTELVTTFTYDDRGNQTTETDVATSTVTTYVYDLADRLAKVTRRTGDGPAAMLASYWYDGEGQRVKKVVGDATTRYYYDGLKLLYTDDGSDRMEETIMEPDGRVFAVKRAMGKHAGNYYFPRKDVRGSVMKVVDGKGSVIAGNDYDAYGRTQKTGDSGLPLSLAYTGAVYDEETGLYYLNARYYDPKIGRFLTRDTIEGQLAYAYCDGNPVNFTDLAGKCKNPLCQLYMHNYPLLICPLCGYIDMSQLRIPKYKLDTEAPNYRAVNGIYYYCQGDYGSKPKIDKHHDNYVFGKDPPYNIAKNGCVACCCAMIASTYEKNYFTPPYLVGLHVMKNTQFGCETYIKEFCISFGYTVELQLPKRWLTKDNRDHIESYLKQGYLVIKNLDHDSKVYDEKKNVIGVTKSGHYVMIAFNCGKFHLFDPGWRSGNGIPIDDSSNGISQASFRYNNRTYHNMGNLWFGVKNIYVIRPRCYGQERYKRKLN